MAGISSTLLDSSSGTAARNRADTVDFKTMTAIPAPRNAMRASGSAVLVAAGLTPTAPTPSLLETAVANLRWMAQFARPLAGQALRTMIATAGSVASLAGQLAALGRPIAQAVMQIAVAVGEVELALALSIAAGLVLVTATPTSSNDMVPNAPRIPPPPPTPRTDRGNSRPDVAVPPTQAQAPKSAVSPAAPSAAQVRQNQASMAAVESLTRANVATPQMYAAVEKFYDVASGGRAARANGSLAAPMQAVRQSRGALNEAIVQSETKIGASAPQDRAALKGWHDTLVTARTSIDTWIASADAFSAGLNRPGGSRTAQPPLPRPPTSVVNAPGSGRTSDQVAQKLVATYEGADKAMRTGTANATSPTRRATTTAAPDPAAAQSKAARALLTQTDPVTARMNKGVEAFYQQAAGGKAARQNGALTEALRSVTESKAELNKLILSSNKSIAASSPADYPSLDRWRTDLRAARDAIDAWLPKANAFAAGLNGAGKPTVQPTLPAVPGVVAGKGGTSSAADSAPLVRAHDGAQAVLSKPAVAGVTAPSGGSASPKVTVVSTMPANVKYQADVWLNRDTGAVSATKQTGPGWVKSVLGMSGMTPPPARPEGVGGGPQQGTKTEATGTPVTIQEAKFYLAEPPNPNGDKDPKDKHNLHVWMGTIAAMTGAVFGGGFLYYSKLGADEGVIAKREADFHPKSDFALFTLPQKTGTPTEKLDAIASAWEHYLGQVPGMLQRSSISDTTVASLADKSEPGDRKFADQFAADARDFVTNLRKEGAAELAKTKDPEAQARVLSALAERQFIPRSFEIEGDASRQLYKTMEGRPSKALSELTPLAQAAVRSKLGSILNSPTTPAKGTAAPGTGGVAPAAGTAAQPVPVAKTAREEYDQILKKGAFLAPPVTPPVTPTATPTITATKPVVKPTVTPSVAPPATLPAAVNKPKPTVTTTPPVAVKPAAPSAAELKKRDEKVVLDLGAAVASAQLNGPPATTTLAGLKFELSMFIEPGKKSDSISIQAGLSKALTIQSAALSAYKNPAVGYDTKMAVFNGPLASIQAVIADLNRLQTEVNQRVAAPAAPIAPRSPAPLDESPLPGDVPTPIPPLKGDTAP